MCGGRNEQQQKFAEPGTNARVAYAIVLLLVSAPLQAASLAGIWMGDSKKDPITDSPSSLAMTFDKADKGSTALRCKNGALNIFVSPKDPQFTVGARQKVALRFDRSDPQAVPLPGGQMGADDAQPRRCRGSSEGRLEADADL